MCAPTYFDIEYEINPWMHTDNQTSRDEAQSQWQAIYNVYTQKLGWEVVLIDPVEGLPDMVFTANGGLCYQDKAVLPNFRQVDRQAETEKFKQWFSANGYQELYMPKYNFEGEGDAFVWRGQYLLIGYPWRTDKASHSEVADYFGLKPISLQLTDARFYHLDTALTIIGNDTIAVYPKAFTEESLNQLRGLVPDLIEANDEDAVAYGLNAMSDGHNVVLAEGADHLVGEYQKRGFTVFPTPISEFQKSGGGVKCLTLELR